MKIYDLNINGIKKDKMTFKAVKKLEEKIEMNNSELKEKCQEYLRNNNKENIFIKYNNKFYKFKKTSVEIENASDFCIDCDFEKECHGKLNICICEALFKDETEMNLKEVEEYEIAFGDDYNEDL